MSKNLLALWTFQYIRYLSSFPIQWLEDFCRSPLIMAGYLDILMTGNSFPSPGIPTLFPQSFVEPGPTSPFFPNAWCGDVMWNLLLVSKWSVPFEDIVNPVTTMFYSNAVPILRSKKWLCNPLSHFWSCLAGTGRSSTSMVDILDDLVYDKSYSHNVS